MKKLIFSVLSILLLITLLGCKRQIRLKNKTATIDNVNKIGKNIKNIDLEFDRASFNKTLNESLDAIMDAKTYDVVDETLYKLINNINDLTNKYYASQALMDYDQENLLYEEKYKNIRDSYNDYVIFYNKMIVELSNNDEYISLFFSGYSQEDIDYEVEMARKKMDEKYIKLTEELDDLVNESNKIDIDLSKQTYDIELLDITYNFINKNKEISELLGYDSYVEYADVSRNRSYLRSDANDFIKNTKTYIVPLMNDDHSFLDIRSSFQKLSFAQQNYYIEFAMSSIFDKDYYTFNLIKDYSKKVGGSYYRTFHDFIDNGKYVFAKSDSSLDVAYTNNMLSFFGKGYQSASSVIHEFGHFYSYTNPLTKTRSLDLNEFYSQSNEFLFTSYLEQNSSKNVIPVYEFKSKELLDNACYTIVIASALREFEEELYSKTLTNKDEIVEIWNKINTNSYKGLLKSFWKLECRYDMYYLSYATSITGAINLYNQSKINLNDGINKYIKAINNQNIDDDIEQILSKCGIYSPFDENAFKEIVKTLEEKR
ncbi:MAG: hypothetical protein K6E87_03185 [bacterium]|nr:hypothetical protein [bacterium]